MQTTPSQEDIRHRLMAQARSLWGDQRADALQASVDAAARQLLEISQNLPGPNTEPGLYPPLYK